MSIIETILITGANGKFGRHMTHHFLKCGMTVVAVGRRENALQELANGVNDSVATRLQTLAVDLTEPDAINSLIQNLDARSLRPDVLINNARNQETLRVDKYGYTPRDAFMGELILGTIVPYELSIALATQSKKKLSVILNIGSMYGVVAVNPSLYDDQFCQSPIQYSVAKAALVHLTRELAVRLANKSVRVNSISFGGVEGRVDEAFKSRYSKLCPMGRMLSEDNIIGPVEFLISPEASGVTGHNLIVDGGWSIW